MKLRHLFFACSGVFVMMFSLLLLVVIVFSDEEDGGSGGNLIYGGVSVSQEVLAHKPMLEKYAREYGIEEYLNVLLAIIQVESGGTLEDVMQSSESLGLPPNSLSTEESIKQGCKYFSELLAAAETKGCDLNSVIQSYNYGGGFLDYVAGHGKKYTFELAESFARDKSGGKKVTYTNPVAVEKNGGWRYSYGNMFYVLLVSQYLTVAPVSYTHLVSKNSVSMKTILSAIPAVTIWRMWLATIWKKADSLGNFRHTYKTISTMKPMGVTWNWREPLLSRTTAYMKSYGRPVCISFWKCRRFFDSGAACAAPIF